MEWSFIFNRLPTEAVITGGRMSAKIYCVCKEADPIVCEKCGKADKLGAEKIGNDTWPRIRWIHKPLIRR